LHFGLGLDFVFVFRVTILCCLCASVAHSVHALLGYVVLGFIFFNTKPRDWLGRTSLKWSTHAFCVKRVVNT